MIWQERKYLCWGNAFSAGARDVFTVPIYMKKNRPAVILTCLCVEKDKDKIIEILFKHTSTIGVRESIMNRYILERKIEEKILNWVQYR